VGVELENLEEVEENSPDEHLEIKIIADLMKLFNNETSSSEAFSVTGSGKYPWVCRHRSRNTENIALDITGVVSCWLAWL
jgi:hypothetical protein